mmetsp:Transcript_28609/g.33251  ORF Transcript_28609/g.33251 Transcript_28609/m.33251 type:complete len:347 (+) Transcript_28609:101-1141(+)
MVRVNYPRRSKKCFGINIPILICSSTFIVILLIWKFSSEFTDETEVLSKFYNEEKDVISHLMYGNGDVNVNGDRGSSTTRVGSNPPGWKPVHIFYGNDKNLAYLGRESQVKQDKLVMGLLNNPKDGYFVDLAANDATNLSNTFQLEKQLNWDGICVEPNPLYWPSLSMRKCNIAAAVVGKVRMEEIKFRMYPDLKRRAPSGGIEGFIDPNIPRSKEKPEDLYTVPFLEILEKFNAPKVIEYLSLDVEGAEFLVMEGFPYDKYRFKVMTIERPLQNLVDLLIQNDYVYLAANNEDGMETSWCHKSFVNEINKNAIKEVEWITGDTKWIVTKNGKLHVNEPKKKRGGK